MGEAGLSPIEFRVQTPDVDCRSHVSHALGLHLGDADQANKELNIIANGPSARDYWPDCTDTMVLNGALGLLPSPTYWVACDPQKLVADYLPPHPPGGTVYLLASKCHPEVFKRLRGHDVRLFHVNDQEVPGHRTIPVACSVTLCALMLAMRLGYRIIHVWGWDLCYRGDEHHAAPSPLPTTAERRQVQVGDDGPVFESNPTWACELTDAAKILPVLKWAGLEIHIHGRSLVTAALPDYAHG